MAYTAIDDPSEYFHIQLWTGTSDDSTKTITNDANAGDFKPDWLWIKARNGNYETRDHALYDSSRGATRRLESNANDAEVNTDSNNTFNTNGFTLTANYSINGPSTTHVGWQWKANGGTTASNDDGSITSTVQANTTAGFSIVTYTGTGSGATVGHGLGATPTWVLVKERGAAGEAWNNLHQGVGEGKTIMLNLTNAEQSSTTMWNNTPPNASVFSVGADAGSNGSSKTYVAYCFTEKKGYSKFSEYTGTGSADGPFVYTGFTPAFIIRKDTGGTEQWTMMDDTRKLFNVNKSILNPNRSNAEAGNANLSIDLLSNGFKVRSGDGASNAAGGIYIYMCFASHPFVSSEGVPATAK